MPKLTKQPEMPSTIPICTSPEAPPKPPRLHKQRVQSTDCQRPSEAGSDKEKSPSNPHSTSNPTPKPPSKPLSHPAPEPTQNPQRKRQKTVFKRPSHPPPPPPTQSAVIPTVCVSPPPSDLPSKPPPVPPKRRPELHLPLKGPRMVSIELPCLTGSGSPTYDYPVNSARTLL
ncbi:rh179 [macacine betaherpesvirus 3]|uniref:Rh179 n=1 Tax=Rhesus cytomegalovirus (strain 68-1) TaxID=47929 RepID=Q2FAC0_RHCM6|nr:rh179 [macacine betaherpesvirus 3]QXV50518.1 protein O23 [macacine betaherpesvirus 3]